MIDFPPPSPSSLSSTTTTTTSKRYRPATECVFVHNTGVSDPYNAASVPIYQSATFKAIDGIPGEYDYCRSGNPTRTHVESHLAKLMHAKRALLVSSGMGAMDVITRIVKPGEQIVAGTDIYGGTNRLLTFLKENNNINVTHGDSTDTAKFTSLLTQNTRMVLLETPTNPLLKVADVPAITRIVHETCPNALVVVDNTMMSPYLMNPLDYGVDVVYHSATKYLAGHHDIMAGVIGVNDEALGQQLYFLINSTGCGLTPFDAFLLLRGTKTLSVRMDRQQSSAMHIASYLESRGFKVNYPGLASHQHHALHASMARGPGSVLSFQTGCLSTSERIVAATVLFGISVSFGCVNSLISMPCKMSHASIPVHVRKERDLPEDLIRLCIGIEDVRDLVEDLENALQVAGWVN